MRYCYPARLRSNYCCFANWYGARPNLHDSLADVESLGAHPVYSALRCFGSSKTASSRNISFPSFSSRDPTASSAKKRCGQLPCPSLSQTKHPFRTRAAGIMVGGGAVSDNVVYRMAMDDPIPWYRKPNLRSLYLLLFPCVIGIEMTSGFDSQIINAAQLVPAWKTCT